MRFSSFAPLGLYRLSGEKPRARAVYEGMVAAHGGQYDMTAGTRQEAFCFATALGVARAERRQRRAQEQAIGTKCTDLLPRMEAIHGIVPGATATTPERRNELAFAQRRPSVWTQANIAEELELLLGSDFIAYRPTPDAEVVRWPTTFPTTPDTPTLGQPMNLREAGVARKLGRVTSPIALVPGTLTVDYELVGAPQGVDGDDGAFKVGDWIVVQEPGEPNPKAYRTVVTAAPAAGQFTAHFAEAFSVGASVFTHPYPRWTSMRRHNLVVLTPSAAADPTKRRVVDRAMRRMARACSTWSIVASTDGITLDTFAIDVPGIGVQVISGVTI